MIIMNRYIIERASLENNIDIICREMTECKIRGVVKGNGYGLDMLPFAETLRRKGIQSFAVTMAEDAAVLNDNGFGNDVLMLRSTDDREELDVLLRSGTILTVGSIRSWNAALEACERNGLPATAHLYFDCGMCREGFDLDRTDSVLPLLKADGPLSVTGVYTHFPRAGGPETDTRTRYLKFRNALEIIKETGWTGELHCANSITALRYPEMRLDSVRIGSAFLGRIGYDGAQDSALRPIGYLECDISEIKDVKRGDPIGYGGIWTAARDSRIAVLNAGYFEGINTEIGREMFSLSDHVRASLSPIKRMIRKTGGLYASVNGIRVPVVGRVAMQQTMLDVTGVPCEVHDVAVLPCNPLLVRNVIREYI